MSTKTGLLRPFGHVEDNPILLDKSVTEPVCEGFNAVLSSFQGHVHDIGERQNGLGGIPAASFSKLAELCCFEQEEDGVFGERQMVEHDLAAEQAIIKLLRQQAAQAESLGDRATRYLYEQILLKTEERAYHLQHFLVHDSLTLAFVGNGANGSN